MNIAKRTIHVLVALSLLGSVASSASAGQCTTESRTFVNGDSVTISCKSATGVTHSGVGSVTISGATKTIIANKTGGGVSILNILVRGQDNAGNTLCQVTDNTVNGVSVSGTCNAATKWNATLVYNN